MEPARTPQQPFTVVEGGSPGSLMRAARERMGLSIEDVCERLKMMPTQVRAMEAGSMEGLPPGGYARAFIKGYARLLGLDADQIVSSMIAANAGARDLEGPAQLRVSPTVAAQRAADAQEEDATYASRRDTVSVSHNFGQLIAEPRGDSRLVKYSLFALAAGLLVYLLVPAGKSGQSELSVSQPSPDSTAAIPAVRAERIPDGQPGAVGTAAADAAFAPGTVVVPSAPANEQVGGSPSAQTASSSVSTAPVSGAGVQVPSAPVVASAPPAVAVAPPVSATHPVQAPPARSSASTVAPAVAAPPVAGAAVGGPQRIRLSFTDRAYITIRDRDGHVLMAQLNPGGTQQTVEGNPPFKIIIGNARAVRLDYRGRPYDLSVHTKDDVARFVLE